MLAGSSDCDSAILCDYRGDPAVRRFCEVDPAAQPLLRAAA